MPWSCRTVVIAISRSWTLAVPSCSTGARARCGVEQCRNFAFGSWRWLGVSCRVVVDVVGACVVVLCTSASMMSPWRSSNQLIFGWSSEPTCEM